MSKKSSSKSLCLLVGDLARGIPGGPRQGDLGAIKTALQVLDDGKTMGIFPEGKRNLTGNGVIAPFQHGAAMIALRSGAPVLPIYISPVRPFRRTYIVAGKPIDLKIPTLAIPKSITPKRSRRFRNICG